MTFPSEIRD